MKSALIFSILICLFFVSTHAQQRVVSECSITYAITTDSSADKTLVESLKSSYKHIYIKSNNARTDLVSPAFVETVFYDKSKSTAVVLREFGSNKFMTKLDKGAWEKQNQLFDGMVVTLLPETKTILGYECKKAMIMLKNGNSFNVYYVSNFIPSAKDFEYQFKDIPGFVLEYESIESNGKRFHYTATKVDVISPVPASKFDIPTSGYRMLN
jgi:GLPGLI family protein